MPQNQKSPFNVLPLHDAVLNDLRIDWSARTCTAHLSMFADAIDHPARKRLITWKEIQEIIIPNRAPWGRSNQINSAHEENGVYLVEMQSGDVIRIVAKSVEVK